MRQAAVASALAIALGAPISGTSPRFRPDDPIAAVPDLHDASAVQRRDISHFRDAWDHIWGVGDRTWQRALDVNSVDEVPDSSWFENRIGTRTMSIAEIAAGPDREGPAPGPWTVVSGKSEGVTPGLQMKDSRGQLFFVKFDPPSNPELGTAAEVISTKLLYDAGYHVPENFIIVFARTDLRIAPGAVAHGSDGRPHPMNRK